MTQLNHTKSRSDLSDAVVAAYIHEISARHANAFPKASFRPSAAKQASRQGHRAPRSALALCGVERSHIVGNGPKRQRGAVTSAT